MTSFVYDLIQVEKVERKLLQAAAAGNLTCALRVLLENGEYFVKKRRKQRSQKRSTDHERRLDKGKCQRGSSDSSDSDPEYSHESEDDLAKKRWKYSYCSRKSRQSKSSQSDVLRESLSNININCKDAEGLTPLHHACYAGSPEMVDFLISEGANIAAQDTKGNSPLHIAAWYGFTDIIAMLRKAGGDMHAVNFEGVTPLIAVEARLERLRKEKEESFKKTKRTYMEPSDWGTRLADELSDDESWWGHSRGEPQPKKDWFREDWSEFLYNDDDDDDDDDDVFLGSSKKKKPKDPLEGGLFKELNEKRKRKREQEERSREAKRILEEEIAKDRAWRERVLQKKGVDQYKLYEISWKKFSKSGNQFLGYSDVPFPVEKGKEAELSRIILHNAPPSEHKQLLRKEILRWHPDKFLQKFRSRLRDSDLERIRERVNELSQALHQLYSSV